MGSRYFLNNFADFLEGAAVHLDKERIVGLIQSYVSQIVQHTWTDVGGSGAIGVHDTDLYVGDAGKLALSFVYDSTMI